MASISATVDTRAAVGGVDATSWSCGGGWSCGVGWSGGVWWSPDAGVGWSGTIGDTWKLELLPLMLDAARELRALV